MSSHSRISSREIPPDPEPDAGPPMRHVGGCVVACVPSPTGSTVCPSEYLGSLKLENG